jgi:uncharacterized membrane protein
MSQHIPAILRDHELDFWLARGAVVVVAALQLMASERVTVGPRLLAPGLEIALLVPLSIGTALTHNQARRATNQDHFDGVIQRGKLLRWLALALTAIVSLVNLASLTLLIRELLRGKGGGGDSLLLDAAAIWLTNMIAFALWFWSLDRQGPASQSVDEHGPPDFLFSAMLRDAGSKAGWRPGFVDYLYLAFTNATALSPADTLPLTGRAKLLMMLEACISLLTIAIVAARAVNILQ